MASDVASRTPATTLAVPRTVHRRRGWLLLAACAFQLWLWGTRIRNLLDGAEGFTAAFLAVHAVLYVAAIGVAVIVGALGWRMLRETRAATGTEPSA